VSGSNIQIQILDLTNNDLGPEAIQSILPLMPTLVSLNLNSCKIGNKGVFDLSHALT
jgi:hypothetical protein